MYDSNQLKEAQVGVKTRTKITEIKEGTQEELRHPKYWEGAKDAEKFKKLKAIHVFTENGANMIINLPLDNSVKKKSNLAKWKRTYGSYPDLGQEIDTRTDENGYPQIVLEQ